MEPIGFEEIARQLIDLLNQQVEAIAGRSFDELGDHEKAAYHKRRQRILELRSSLGALSQSHSL